MPIGFPPSTFRGSSHNILGWLLIAPTLLIVGGMMVLSTGGLDSPIIHWIQLERQRKQVGGDIERTTRYDPIQDAVKSGDLEAVGRRLAEDPTSITARDPFGWTPLHLASWNHNDIAALLLEHGAILEAQDRGGLTPLALAARNGNDGSVRFFIERGANLKAQDFSGRTPLHYTAQYGHAGSAQILLDHHTPVDIRDGHQMTPLMYASLWGREDVTLLLVRHGANVNAREANSWTPLHRAVAGGLSKPNPVVAKILLQHGAAVNAQTTDGNTPLLFAASQNDPEVIRLLLEHGADPRIRNASGTSPLWASMIVPADSTRTGPNESLIAGGDHYAEIAELLLSRGADPNIVLKNEGAPLHQAARSGGTQLAKALLAHGARVDVANLETGATPLLMAAELGHAEVVKVLVAAGANANHRDKLGNTPLLNATSRYPRLIRYGEEFDTKDPDTQGWIESVRVLLDAGASPNVRDSNRSTPLHHAARNGSAAITRMLISHQAEIDPRDDGGATPLLRAAAFDRLACAELLLQVGANPNQKEFAQRTPLAVALRRYAGQRVDEKMVALLRQYGAHE